jgi:methyltransferase (TIGR00027 family)
MNASAEALLQDVSDTARWAAVFRARESLRPDALFRDPFAERLAGARGFAIAATLSEESHATSWVVRTHLFDLLIARAIFAGAELVVNLGAGLDARPYRLDLPATLDWVEVDLPRILDYKEQMLASERPACRLERVGLDLRDRAARRALLARLQARRKRTLVVTEGVLIYLPPEEVAALARDLAAQPSLQSWICEIASPGVLENMRRTAGGPLSEAGVRFEFAPAEGPSFFAPCGWEPVDVLGVLKTAVRLRRTPIDPKFLDLIPDLPAGAHDALPWVGVCLFQRADALRESAEDAAEKEPPGDSQAGGGERTAPAAQLEEVSPSPIW